MQFRERLEAYLREHQVPFQIQQHGRSSSAQRIAESEHISSKMGRRPPSFWQLFTSPGTYHVTHFNSSLFDGK